MMDNEADMVILFVSCVVCVTEVWPDIDMSKAANWAFQKLQIPIFMVNKAPDVQL